MKTRGIKFWSWTAAALLVVASVGAIAAALCLPLDGQSQATGKSASPTRIATPKVSQVTMQDFEPYVATALRRPPPAPPPPPPPPPVAVADTPPVPIVQPGADIHLLGTVIEPNDYCAIFQTLTGIELKRRGDMVGGGEITDVTEGVAVIKRDGQSIVLKVPPPQ